MIEQQIKDAYQNLPLQVKKAIADSNWAEEIGRIGKKFNLRLDQTAALEDNVTLIMLGLLSVTEFVENFKSDMDISAEDIRKGIISDLEKNIFAKIRAALVEETLPAQKTDVKIPEPSAPFVESDTQPTTTLTQSAPEPISIITPQEQTVIEPDPVSLPMQQPAESRDEILSQIENPVKTETQLVKNTQVTVAPVITKPLTAPIAPTQPKPARVDPYREPIV